MNYVSQHLSFEETEKRIQTIIGYKNSENNY